MLLYGEPVCQVGSGNTAAKGTIRLWQLILPGSVSEDLDLKGLGDYSVVAFERAFIISSSKPFLPRTCLQLRILPIAFICDWRKAP